MTRRPAPIKQADVAWNKLGHKEPWDDFQMFKTLELNNFKCFRSLKLDGLKRVNVIVGANATGKSSLLEAIVCGARATPDGPSAFVFSATTAYAESENIQWFSQLREDGNSADVISFITEAFPFITNLEILSSSGTPGIYASLTDGGLRKLQLISSGINKIITILLACARAKGGIVLIDEIENGIFYDKYELMWSILYKFAKRFNFQLFVTSHSLECLERIVPVIGDNEEDFSLIRTEREDNQCIARHMSGVSMKAALRRGVEVRGVTPGYYDHIG